MLVKNPRESLPVRVDQRSTDQLQTEDCYGRESSPQSEWHFVFHWGHREQPQLQFPGVVVASHPCAERQAHNLLEWWTPEVAGHDNPWEL